MRNLLAAVFLLLFSINLSAQRDPDAIVKGLHGKVHSVRIEAGREGSTGFTLQSEQTFNPEGWLIEDKVYGFDDQLMAHTLFKRNGPRIIECDSTIYFPPENAKRIVTSFEEHGFPRQQVTYSPDGRVRERMAVVYEETQVRELHYDADDKLVSTRTISTLHDPNSPDRHVEQRVNGQPENITDIHKSDGAIEVKQREYKDGQVASDIVRDITKSGTSTGILTSDGRFFASSTRNHDTDEMVNPDGSQVKSKFDTLGQRIEEDRYNAAGKLTESTNFAYETDDHGNWIRRTATNSGQPGSSSVLVRTITYY